MGSFGALHASCGERVVGGARGARLARKGALCGLQSVKNRLGARGMRRGYHKQETRRCGRRYQWNTVNNITKRCAQPRAMEKMSLTVAVSSRFARATEGLRRGPRLSWHNWGEHTTTYLASDVDPIFQSLQRVTWLQEDPAC